MKQTSLSAVYGYVLVAIVALIVVHAPLQVFFGSLAPEYALYIKAWKEILMLVALVMAIVLITQAGKWSELGKSKLFWAIVAYAALHLLALLQWQGVDASLAGIIIDLRYVLFFGLVYVLVWLYPSYLELIKKVAVGGSVVVVGFGMLQLVLPYDALRVIGYGPDTIRPYTTVDRNYDFIRYQSTLRGPNPYGAYAASVVAIAIAWLTARRWDWRVGVLAAAATYATYLSHSRSAFIALGAGVAAVLAYRYARKIRLWQWGAIAGMMIVVVLGLFMLRDSYFVSNVLLHEDPVGGSSVSSNDEHLRSLTEGTEEALADPLGDGIGSTGSASLLGAEPNIIENQYLMIAQEVGWAGLAVFLVIFAAVMRRLWVTARHDPWVLGVFASGIGLALIGMLLPVWADDTVAILWWGLAAAVIAPTARSDKAQTGL